MIMVKHKQNYQLVDYELYLPSKYDGMKLKGFCIYHKADFIENLTKNKSKSC